MHEPKHPRELIEVFSRCPNYPKGEDALALFAQGLAHASEVTGIPMPEIVQRCKATSSYCPTDYDLLNIAHELKADRDRAAAPALEAEKRKQWEAECGPPEPFNFTWALDRFNFPRTGNQKKDFDKEIEACRLQAIQDSLFYTEGPGRDRIEGKSKEKRDLQAFWQDAMAHHNKMHPEEVSIIRLQMSNQIMQGPPQ